MISDCLLRLLRCPVSLEKLQRLDSDGVRTVNGLIAAGRVENAGGRRVQELLDEALVDSRREWIVPIRGGIVTMVGDELISCRLLDG